MAWRGRAIEDRVLTEELSEMLQPLGVKQERMAAAMGVLGIKSTSHGRQGVHRVASVSVAEAEKIIGWLLATRRGD